MKGFGVGRGLAPAANIFSVPVGATGRRVADPYDSLSELGVILADCLECVLCNLDCVLDIFVAE